MSSQFMVFGQTKNDEKKLNSMFWSGNYKEIILDYALLYNKDRKNLDVNFKYGTCLLFESDSLSTMNKAIGHLTFACASEESLAEYHYFLGRALHRIADYNGALKQFDLYKRKKTKTTAALDADLFISYCSNALNLKELANASYSKTGTIIPAEIGKSYNLNQIDLSGKFFNSIEFQSKIDKKRNYEPLIYKPENATLRFYASFGDKDEGNKDIYMVSGSYEDKKITRLPSIINSNSDEALPVFDEKTHYLYFSSLGHNSSGGYDIYRSKLDSITNEFSVPENLGQGISTPYDDFLFMYNSSNNKSLITSTKLSTDGELSIFQGTVSFLDSKKNSSNLVQVQFNNGGNNAIKLTTILVKDSLNNTIAQVTKSSEKEAVELNLPPGTYRYFIELSGSKDFFEAQIVIPEKQETISQIIEYSIDDLNTELVRINQPDSNGNSNTSIAKNISPTDVNETMGATVIDEKLEKEVLEKLNVENFSQVEVIDDISDRIIEFELTQKENEELADRLNLAIVNNQEYYQQLQDEIDSISKELDETTNIEKIEILKYIQNTLAEQEEILQQTIWLQALNDSIRNDIKNKTNNFNTVQSIGKNLTELTHQENEAEAYKLILDNYQSINSLSATSALKKNYNDLLDVELELSRLDKKIIQLTNDKIKLDEDLKQAEINARNASKKEKINLDQSITEIKQKIVSIEKQINKYKLDKSELSILKTDKELKRNILSSILKEDIDESLSYETALKHYLPSSINIRNKTNEINLQLNETEGKLTSNEINYLNQRKLYLSKKEILSENYPNQEQLIQIEKEYVESIKSLIEQTKNSDTTLFTEFLNEKLQESYAKLQALQDEQNPNEITKSDVTQITPDKSVEKQDENQNKPEKVDEITKSDVTQINPDKSDEKQDENQNKPEKVDEITKSDVTQINPDKSDEKQDENQNKPEKVDEITKSDVKQITPDKSDEKQDENQNKPDKVDEITKSDVKQITPDKSDEKQDENQNKPEKVDEITKSDVTQITPDKSDEKQNENQNKPEKVDEITKSDVTQITPDKSDEKQNENQNKPEKVDEITKSDLKQISPDKSDEKQDENQNKPEKVDEITKSDVTQITPDKSDEKQDENQNKLEKVDEITKSDVTQITPDKSDEKQNENQNKPEKVDEITKSDVTQITPDKSDEKQDENQNKLEKVDEITKSDVTKNQDLSNEILSQELPEKSNVLIDATVTDLRNSTNEIKKEKSSIYREIQVSYPNLPLYSTEKLKHDEALLIDQLKKISDEINLTKNNKAINKNKIINKELDQRIGELGMQQDELSTKLTNIQIELEKENLSEINIGMNSNTVDLDITKQQEIASTQEYRNYVEQLVAFENSSRNLKLINDTIALIQAAIDQEITYLLLNPEKEKGRIIIEQLIQQLEVQVSKRNNISSNLTAIKREINRNEETSPINKNDLRYLASARIEPIKKIASSPEQDIIPKTGFNLNAQESYYSSKNPIPQNVKPPSGLVYRVQVGAFRKPIPQNLYSAFNPVSGELAPNGLTLYMAGYFNSSNNAVSARKQIQQLGYTDAFVVAYCNGRKISLGEARQLESRGECVPLDSNQFILEIVQRTKEAMSNQGISVVELPGDFKKSSNLDPKDSQKLYYTVQVGVYNQLINEKIKFPALSEIATHKIATGQIRYSTGKFTDLSSAKVRKEKAVQSGIKDAFIVAYYNGERITIAAANELLSRYGDSILFRFPSMIVQPANETAYQTLDKKYFTNSEITFEPELKRYQTIDEFENFPLEKLAYFNQFGLFQYNPATKKIESASYTNVLDLDNSIRLSGYFSQIKFKPSISTTETEGNISGDLADFMLHSHSVQQIRSNDNIHIDFEKSYFNDANYTNLLKNTFQLIIK